MPGRFSTGWRPASRFSCVTGNCQIAILWAKASEDDPRFLAATSKLLDQQMVTQSTTSSNPGILGAIPGSRPVWGEYNPLSYPNWAAKFFIDAIRAEEDAIGVPRNQPPDDSR